MTNKELAAALRKCGRVKGPDDCSACQFYKGDDPALCIPAMTSACADALENSESHVMALQREIEKLRGQLERRWIPVTERLPEDCADVLALVTGLYGKCSFERAPMLCAWFGKDGWFCNEYPNWDNPGVTHWMPLPEGPEGPEEGV